MTNANPGQDADAINPGQQAEDPTTEEQDNPDLESLRPRRSRGLDLETIAANRAAERDADMQAHGFTPADTRPDPDDDPDAPTPDAAAQAAAAPPPPPPEPQSQQAATPDELLSAEDEKRKVVLNIDGVQVTTTIEQLKRDAQKAGAADKRLREANELLARARETVARVPPSPAPAAVPPAPQANVKEKTKAFSDAIYEGDPEKAAAEIDAVVQAAVEARLAAMPSQTPVDTRQIAAEVNQLRDQESALQEVAAEYPLTQANEFTAEAANRFYVAAKAEGKSEAEAIREAAVKTYETFGYVKQTSAPPPTPTTPRSERANALKGSLDIPAGRSVSAAKVDQTPTSSEGQRSAAIAEIARRGRPIARR